MIQVRASLVIYADDDKKADAVLQRLLEPAKGVTIHVTEASRELVR